jgi:hypothetical protein
MPIKEIMTFGFGVFLTIFVTNGPLYFKEAVRRTQVGILREVSRTDNWGNPSIFASKHKQHNSKNWLRK